MHPFGNAYAGRRVLVTGHTGFKGSWLCEWLLMRGAQVTGYALDPIDPSLFAALGLEHRLNDIRADIRDLDSLTRTVIETKPEIVFHLAAQPLVRLSYKQPVDTFTTNVTGSVHVMEAVRVSSHPCALVMITTDKCYENREWLHGYREEDPMGGYDPYSASKGCAELAVSAYRRSFFSSHEKDAPAVPLASARAGNVIGGGDWAIDRIVPDSMAALARGEAIPVRNKKSTRPWQHVLEPLSGYLSLGSLLHRSFVDPHRDDSANATKAALRSAFNFGPALGSNRSVADLVQEILRHWPGEWLDQSEPSAPHEAGLLNLAIDKAHHVLGWRPVWDFEETVAETVGWYRTAHELNGGNPEELRKFTCGQIQKYECAAAKRGVAWATK